MAHARGDGKTHDFVMQAEAYSGPVVHPSIAGGWENVVPGSAERILAMAEQQARHRRFLEKMLVIGRTFSQLLGALAGALIGGGAVYAGYLLLMADKNLAGFGIIVAGIGPIVWAFRRTTSTKQPSSNRPQGD